MGGMERGGEHKRGHKGTILQSNIFFRHRSDFFFQMVAKGGGNIGEEGPALSPFVLSSPSVLSLSLSEALEREKHKRAQRRREGGTHDDVNKRPSSLSQPSPFPFLPEGAKFAACDGDCNT